MKSWKALIRVNVTRDDLDTAKAARRAVAEAGEKAARQASPSTLVRPQAGDHPLVYAIRRAAGRRRCVLWHGVAIVGDAELRQYRLPAGAVDFLEAWNAVGPEVPGGGGSDDRCVPFAFDAYLLDPADQENPPPGV